MNEPECINRISDHHQTLADIGRGVLFLIVAAGWGTILVDMAYQPKIDELAARLIFAEETLRAAQDRLGAMQYHACGSTERVFVMAGGGNGNH